MARKFVVFYAAWLGLAMVARSVLVTLELLQLAAVAYWFGWLFAVATAAVGVLVVATSALDQYWRTARQSKYEP